MEDEESDEDSIVWEDEDEKEKEEEKEEDSQSRPSKKRKIQRQKKKRLKPFELMLRVANFQLDFLEILESFVQMSAMLDDPKVLAYYLKGWRHWD